MNIAIDSVVNANTSTGFAPNYLDIEIDDCAQDKYPVLHEDKRYHSIVDYSTWKSPEYAKCVFNSRTDKTHVINCGPETKVLTTHGYIDMLECNEEDIFIDIEGNHCRLVTMELVKEPVTFLTVDNHSSNGGIYVNGMVLM